MNPINYNDDDDDDDVQPANSLVKGELFISKYNYDNCVKLSDAVIKESGTLATRWWNLSDCCLVPLP